MTTSNVLSVAGSDPSGGAGIQADLKTFAALGAYGCAAITALTAQSTRGVAAVQPIAPSFVAAQLDVLLEDVRVVAAKVGMVGTAAVGAIVGERLAAHGVPFVVVDPVMIAKGGVALVDTHGGDGGQGGSGGAVAALIEGLLRRAHLVTPNLPEVGALLGRPAPATVAEMIAAARALAALLGASVLVKGGHLEGPGEGAIDVLVDGAAETLFELPRLPGPGAHGTGCTLSSAIAALRPRRPTLAEAVRDAKAYVHGAISAAGALSVGHGHRPLNHFYRSWS